MNLAKRYLIDKETIRYIQIDEVIFNKGPGTFDKEIYVRYSYKDIMYQTKNVMWVNSLMDISTFAGAAYLMEGSAFHQLVDRLSDDMIENIHDKRHPYHIPHLHLARALSKAMKNQNYLVAESNPAYA